MKKDKTYGRPKMDKKVGRVKNDKALIAAQPRGEYVTHRKGGKYE